MSPIIVPLVVSALGYYSFLGRFRLTGTHLGVILAHTALSVPLSLLVITAALKGLDPNLERAAMSAGAGPLRTFWWVLLPVLRPGLLVGGAVRLSPLVRRDRRRAVHRRPGRQHAAEEDVREHPPRDGPGHLGGVDAPLRPDRAGQRGGVARPLAEPSCDLTPSFAPARSPSSAPPSARPSAATSSSRSSASASPGRSTRSTRSTRRSSAARAIRRSPRSPPTSTPSPSAWATPTRSST